MTEDIKDVKKPKGQKEEGTTDTIGKKLKGIMQSILEE